MSTPVPAGCIPKPAVMRDFGYRWYIKGLISGMVAGVVVGGIFWYTYVVPKREKYRKYRESYDGEAEFKRMADLGLFQSVNMVKKAREEGRLK